MCDITDVCTYVYGVQSVCMCACTECMYMYIVYGVYAWSVEYGACVVAVVYMNKVVSGVCV